MPSKKIQKERRKHKRYRVTEGTLVILGSVNAPKCLIINISLSGLSFRYYTETTELKDFSPTETGKLDITRKADNLNIRQIPFETVYDIEIEDENPWQSFKTRRRGVRFTRLTRQHKSQIQKFIKEHSAEISKGYDSEEF